MRCIALVALVVKGHWLEAQYRIAGSLHRFNVLLEPLRRAHRAELTGGVDEHCYCVVEVRCYAPNVADETAVVDLSSRTSNTNHIMRVDNCATGVRAYTDVETGERMFERSRTDSCVAGDGVSQRRDASRQ